MGALRWQISHFAVTDLEPTLRLPTTVKQWQHFEALLLLDGLSRFNADYLRRLEVTFINTTK
jgi:hypothetical protein